MNDALPDRANLVDALVSLAGDAGDIVWRHFVAGCTVATKSDDSPVTAADREAEEAILAALTQIAPGVPVVAEEQAAEDAAPTAATVRDGAFFLVDPVDGTKEFVRRGTDFTVNIALVEAGVPTVGVIYAPARDILYWGVEGHGAWSAPRRPDGTRGEAAPLAVTTPDGTPCAVASKSHAMPGLDAWLDAAGIAQRVAIGSSLKFALVATGEADVYPRTGPTMEWDTAAGDAIVRAAGGRTLDAEGMPLRYGKPGFRNGAFVVTGGYQPAPIGPYLP